MTRGLLWLPLLAVFIWLAWAGWNEYQKLEAYRRWAEQFDHAKYDIYAVLGQKGSDLTWGKPTRKAPLNLQTFSLQQVEAIWLQVGSEQLAVGPPESIQTENSLPASDQPSAKGAKEGTKRGAKGPIALRFRLSDQQAAGKIVEVPFTELELATQWGNHLYQDWQTLQS